MRKIKVGILTFSDGRKYIHESLVDLNQRYQANLSRALQATREIEVVAGQQIVWNNDVARQEGQRMAQAGCDLTICNYYAIWCYPHLTRRAGDRLCGWTISDILQRASVRAGDGGHAGRLGRVGPTGS